MEKYFYDKTLDYSQIAGDTFFKYALQQDNERSEFCRKKLIKYIFDLDVISTKVLNTIQFRESMDDKEMILDVHAIIDDTNHVDLEMQQSRLYGTHSRRFQLYENEMLLSQTKKGDKYYNLVKPVYSGIFVDDDIGVSNLVAHYGMYERDDHTLLKDNLHYLNIIQMKKINSMKKEFNEFEKLVYIFKNGPKDVKILPEESLVIYIMELYKEFTEDEPVWSLSKNRERARMQNLSLMAELEEEKEKIIKEKKQLSVFNAQLTEANEKAFKEINVLKEQVLNSVKVLANNGVSNDIIAISLNLTVEEVKEILK